MTIVQCLPLPTTYISPSIITSSLISTLASSFADGALSPPHLFFYLHGSGVAEGTVADGWWLLVGQYQGGFVLHSF